MNTIDAALITPGTRRKANGWVATLTFPNGGVQVGISRYWTEHAAQRSAETMLHLRTRYPDKVVPDPQPNQMMEL